MTPKRGSIPYDMRLCSGFPHVCYSASRILLIPFHNSTPTFHRRPLRDLAFPLGGLRRLHIWVASPPPRVHAASWANPGAQSRLRLTTCSLDAVPCRLTLAAGGAPDFAAAHSSLRPQPYGRAQASTPGQLFLQRRCGELCADQVSPGTNVTSTHKLGLQSSRRFVQSPNPIDGASCHAVIKWAGPSMDISYIAMEPAPVLHRQ
jgi:hypothetical protein